MWKYPSTIVKPVTDILHGQKVIDNYRWLEDATNPSVRSWVKKQNSFTERTIEENAPLKRLHDELTTYFDVPSFGVAVVVKDLYFWTERKPGQQQWVVYVKHGLDGEPQTVIDPNGLNEASTISVSYWFESTSGEYVAYGLDEGGNEKPTLRIKVVKSGKDLEDVIENVTSPSLRWLPDDSGFFYIRGPKPGTVPADEERLWARVYLHKLGAPVADDELIFGEDRPKDDMLGLTLTLDGRYLGISATQSWTRNDLYLYDTKTKGLRELVVGIDAQFGLHSTNDTWILKTNYQAQNNRILSAPIASTPANIDEWEEFIPESDDILDWFAVTADKILVGYMVNACDRVALYDHSGHQTGELPLPPLSVIAGVGTRRAEKEFFFSSTNFVTPRVAYRYDPAKAGYEEYRREDEPIKPSDYIVKQEWATSKDGTKFPMFIVHHKNVKLDGHNPTILHGYGGYGFSEQPSFLRGYIPWLKNKGIFAVANLRGGGGYGEDWHRAAILDKKQNTFDDFIAAAEYLISNKYTDSKHLGIRGGSNGGLLVGAVMTQRPELFKAVISQVPLLDMYRFHNFLIAGRWTHEYGNPDSPDEFAWIKKWSPYHHVAEGVEYPNILLTTASNDTRVHPLHAWKMAALLQATNKKNIILLRTEMDAGHASGKPLNKFVEDASYTLAFFAWQLGLKIGV